MSKDYTSLGLMSGTSGDGVDASLIISDGINNYKVIQDNILNMTMRFLKIFTI